MHRYTHPTQMQIYFAHNVVVCTSSSGTIPSISKLSPGQAAYHFLAGFQDGKFVPAYCKGPSPFDPLELSQALFSEVIYGYS